MFVKMNKLLSRFVISLLSFVLALTVVSPFSSKAEEEHKFNQKEVDELAQALQVTFEQSSIKSEGKIIEYQKSTIVNNLQNNKY
ncbi:hypothetical protein CM54_03135 [Staphylococcus sp. TE8]|nr:hypothetical protein CM54_03135 [Staphylococcus sp. TE8]